MTRARQLSYKPFSACMAADCCGFQASVPADLQGVGAAGPSGCTYWKLAAEGKIFYTEAADHYNCPIGSFTHGIDLPPAQGAGVEGLVGR